MLLAPILYYGSAREDDIDGYQFVILFRSIFQEGFARPRAGSSASSTSSSALPELGGELRMRAGVRAIRVRGGCGSRRRARRRHRGPRDACFSSAGLAETMQLAGAMTRGARASAASRSSRRSRSLDRRTRRSATTRR
jgi:phytoene dehydrogenase-like protein